MSESEIINNIFSEALHQLERRWQDDSTSDRVRGGSPPEHDATGEEPEIWAENESDDGVGEGDTADPSIAVPDRKESMVAPKRDDDDRIPDIPPEISPAAEEDDLDSLLEDLAKSADPDGKDDDAFSGFFGGEDGGTFGNDPSGRASFGNQLVDGEDAEHDSSGNSLDDLLEHALGLADTPAGGDLPEFAADEEDNAVFSESIIPAFEPDDEEPLDQDEDAAGMVEPAFDREDGAQPGQSDDFDSLIGSASDEGESEDFPALSDDLFATHAGDDDEYHSGQDLSGLLDGDNEATGDVVRTVKVPEPSVPLVEDADEELERKLAEMGLGDDNLLHNRFSAGKEKLLRHLLARFEALARQKLEPLPTDQVNLVRSVNLRVEIDLKFGEFTATGNDDSLFKLDV